MTGGFNAPASVGLGGLPPESDVTPTPDGGAMVEFGPAEAPTLPPDHNANLAEHLDEKDLLEVAAKVIDEFEDDERSRSEWEELFTRGVDLLGLKIQETSEPFEGATTAVHPLLIENVVKFQAKASGELLPAGGPVKTQIIGRVDLLREQQAARVKEFMNYQLTEQTPEYFDESERLLFYLPLMGSCFKKLYYNGALGRIAAECVPMTDFYVSNFAQSLRTADRYTHKFYRTPTQLESDIVAGLYLDVDLGDPTTPTLSRLNDLSWKITGMQPAFGAKDEVYTILEQHRYLALPGDDANLPPAPYVVTVEKESRKVLSIRRLWREGDSLRRKIVYFTHYRYVPGFGFYGLGLVHFLGNLTMAATHAMRALLDAGQFANMQGGIKLSGMRFTDDGPIGPGQFKDANYDGDDIRKGIMLYPFKEPSTTLFNMFKEVVGAGQKFADTTDQVISESTNYGPVATTLALLEASTKFFSAVHKRLHKAQREEFKLLAELNYDWLPDEYPYDVVGGNRSVFKQDFDGRVDVIPVSDPNTPSAGHRLAKAQLVYELAKQEAPGTLNKPAVLRYMLTAADIPNVESFIVDPEQSVEPRDPMSDIKAALQGLPVRAFPGQDHQAYIGVFSSFVQDPTIGSNPTFAPVLQILTAAIRDHQVAQWMMQVESIMRAGGPPPQGTMPEQIMAQAAQEVKSANDVKAQMMGGQPNPEMLLAQAAMTEAQTKQTKVASDQIEKAAQRSTENRRLDLEAIKVALEAKVAHMDLQAGVAKNVTDSNTKMAIEATKRLIDDAKQRDDRENAVADREIKHKEIEVKRIAARRPRGSK